MAPAVQRYFQEGLAPSTRITYNSAMKRFYSFCTHYNIFTPLPVTEHLLCCFAAHLADQDLAHQTVKGYLAAVRNTQISLGFPDPRDQSSMPVLKRVQMGIQRVRSGRGPPSRSRLPITATVHERIRCHLESPNQPHRELLWAICCTAVLGFFRLGELLPERQLRSTPSSSVMWGDVAVDDREQPSMVRIHLKRSKGDQFGAGADIIFGKTGLPLCPVSALLAYIEVRGSAPGRLFNMQTPSQFSSPGS